MNEHQERMYREHVVDLIEEIGRLNMEEVRELKVLNHRLRRMGTYLTIAVVMYVVAGIIKWQLSN